MRKAKIGFKYLISYFLLFVSIFLMAEVILRVFNFEPYYASKSEIEIIPNDSFFEKNSILGFKHLSGKFKIILKTIRHKH